MPRKQPSTLLEVGIVPPKLPKARLKGIYEKRRERFNKMLNQVEPEAAHLHSKILQSLALTDQAHNLATSIVELVVQLMARARTSTKDQLDSFFARLHNVDTPANPEVLAQAERFVRDVFVRLDSEPHKVMGKSLEVLIIEAFPSLEGVQKIFLVAAIGNFVEMFRMHRKATAPLAPLAILLYSMVQALYLGIFELSGNSLARKEALEKGVGLLEDGAGSFADPIAVSNLVRKVSDFIAALEIPQSTLRNAADAEIYFTRYAQVTADWIQVATNQEQACRQVLAAYMDSPQNQG